MERIPKKLNKCPLFDVAFEIRFIPDISPEMVISEVYLNVKDVLGSYKDLPIMELPAEIRRQDPNLKYSPYYEFKEKDSDFFVRVGPRMLAFHVHPNYPGWSSWFDYIKTVMDQLKKSSFLGNVERIGLRYINFFEGITKDFLDHTNVVLSVRNHKFSGKNILLRFEETLDPDKNFIAITQIVSPHVKTKTFKDGRSESQNGSIIDIDCIHNMNKPSKLFYQKWEQFLEELHHKEKELFFGLLEKNFLDSLDPEWGE